MSSSLNTSNKNSTEIVIHSANFRLARYSELVGDHAAKEDAPGLVET